MGDLTFESIIHEIDLQHMCRNSIKIVSMEIRLEISFMDYFSKILMLNIVLQFTNRKGLLSLALMVDF